MSEHELTRTQLAPDVYAWCKCGARFDAYGEKGAMNKLHDHIRAEKSSATEGSRAGD